MLFYLMVPLLTETYTQGQIISSIFVMIVLQASCRYALSSVHAVTDHCKGKELSILILENMITPCASVNRTLWDNR